MDPPPPAGRPRPQYGSCIPPPPVEHGYERGHEQGEPLSHPRAGGGQEQAHPPYMPRPWGTYEQPNPSGNDRQRPPPPAVYERGCDSTVPRSLSPLAPAWSPPGVECHDDGRPQGRESSAHYPRYLEHLPLASRPQYGNYGHHQSVEHGRPSMAHGGVYDRMHEQGVESYDDGRESYPHYPRYLEHPPFASRPQHGTYGRHQPVEHGRPPVAHGGVYDRMHEQGVESYDDGCESYAHYPRYLEHPQLHDSYVPPPINEQWFRRPPDAHGGVYNWGHGEGRPPPHSRGGGRQEQAHPLHMPQPWCTYEQPNPSGNDRQRPPPPTRHESTAQRPAHGESAARARPAWSPPSVMPRDDPPLFRGCSAHCPPGSEPPQLAGHSCPHEGGAQAGTNLTTAPTPASARNKVNVPCGPSERIPPGHGKNNEEVNAYVKQINASDADLESFGDAVTIPGLGRDFLGSKFNSSGVPEFVFNKRGGQKYRWTLQIDMPCEASLGRSGNVCDEEIDVICQMKDVANLGRAWKDKQNSTGNTLCYEVCLHDVRCPCKLKAYRFPDIGRIGIYKAKKHDFNVHNLPPKKGLLLDACSLVDQNYTVTEENLYELLEKAGLNVPGIGREGNTKRIETRKKEYSRDRGRLEQMKVSELKKILDKHMVPLDRLLETVEAAVEEAIEKSDVNILNRVFILDHDVDESTGRWTKIIYTTTKILVVGRGIKSMNGGTGRVQLEIDFMEMIFANNYRKVGGVGLSDTSKYYYDLVEGLFMGEDAENAIALIEVATKIVEHFDGIVNRVLKDGGKALQAATDDLAFLSRMCIAHALRFPGQRGAGRRGTMGSLIRYLVTSNKLPLIVVSVITSQWFALHQLPSLAYYAEGRDLFREMWGGIIKKHVYEFYIPPSPKLGAAMTFPGEAANTNGQEKGWDYKRMNKNAYMRTHRNESEVMGILHASAVRDCNLPEAKRRNFQVTPNQKAAVWRFVESLANNASAKDDARASIYYSLATGKLLTHKEAVGNARELGGYVKLTPTVVLNDRLKKEARNTRIDDSGSFHGHHSGVLAQAIEANQANLSALASMPYQQRFEYVRLLAKRIVNNTPERMPGETFVDYVKRNGQRTETIDLLLKEGSQGGAGSSDVTPEYMQSVERKMRLDEDNALSTVATEVRAQLKEHEGKRPDDEDDVALRVAMQEEVDEVAKSNQKGRGVKSSRVLSGRAKTILDVKGREKLCKVPLGHFREVIVTGGGEVSCLCDNFRRNCQCYESAVVEVIENAEFCPAEFANADEKNYDDIRQQLIDIHRAEIFSDDDKVKQAYKMIPENDPLFNYSSIINGVPVPGSKGKDGKPVFGIDVELDDGKLVVTSVDNNLADVFVGETVTKINGTSVVDGNGVCNYEVASVKNLMEKTEMRATGKGTMTLSVVRMIRRGSVTGGVYRPSVYSAREHGTGAMGRAQGRRARLANETDFDKTTSPDRSHLSKK